MRHRHRCATVAGIPTPHDQFVRRNVLDDLGHALAIVLFGILYLAADFARQRGVIIADTKFEFGKLPDGRLILIDEVLTPDSSRFWPADDYAPGRDQASFDKQYMRNYLEGLDWNKQPPAPQLPEDVVAGTRRRYMEAYRLLTGKDFR